VARRTEESAPEPPALAGREAASESTPEAPQGTRETRPTDGSRSGWGPADGVWFALVTLGAGILRLFRVADPRQFVFDEVYYAKDACMYVHASIETCKLDDFQNEVHPPLGKWLIASGIKLFGFDSLGYRIVVVLAGTVTVALLFLLARMILRSTMGAGIAAGLLAIDPLHFVQSRTSMLDIFVPLFTVAAFLFLVLDRRRLLRTRSREGPPGGLLARPWRLAAGVAAGAAFASKWSGAVVIVAAVVLTLAWEIGARVRKEGRGRAIVATLRQEGATIVLWLIVLPIALYVLSYAGRGLEGPVLAAPWAEGSWWRSFWQEQYDSWIFHTQTLKDSSHPYQSPGWSWILLKRPVSYFFETDDEGNYLEILATGSPFVWWASIGAMVYVTWQWLRRRGLARPEGVILAGFLFTYGPWLLPVERPTVFLFYFVTTIPFMCLALAYVAVRIGRSWEARSAIAAFCAIALAFFIFYFPMLTKRPIPRSEWTERLLFFDDCDKPPGRQLTTTVTETVNGTATTSPSVSDTNEDVPPPGWCWI
jgi:dolichyl-phosphate-mannose--protein O-mannosyl transferase